MITILSSPLTWFFLCLGLILGSFFNVCIYRIPRGIFWKSHRSQCLHCGKAVPWWLNIPVFSYLFLRGKSRCCKKALPLFYPLVELFTGILFVYLYWRFPFVLGNSLPAKGFDLELFSRFLFAAIFVSLLLICSVIDMHHMIIPDVISLPMILASPLVAWLHPSLTFYSSILGAFLGGGVIYAIAWIYFLVRKQEGMGMGDAKLLAAIGGWLGYESLFPTIFLGSLLGSILGVSLMIFQRRFHVRMALPFGPFLSLGAAFYLLSPWHWTEILFQISKYFSS